MNVSLTPKLEKWVQERVQSGLYNSSSEVVRDALRLLYDYESERQRKLEQLKSDLILGHEQLKSGKKQVFDPSVIADIKRRGREQAVV